MRTKPAAPTAVNLFAALSPSEFERHLVKEGYVDTPVQEDKDQDGQWTSELLHLLLESRFLHLRQPFYLIIVHVERIEALHLFVYCGFHVSL
jgi:hypothetical protein